MFSCKGDNFHSTLTLQTNSTSISFKLLLQYLHFNYILDSYIPPPKKNKDVASQTYFINTFLVNLYKAEVSELTLRQIGLKKVINFINELFRS